MTLLRIENLSLSIHSYPVLNDVSIDIAEGEIVAITGESGSGKSMTAFTVMGLTPDGTIANGTVAFEGQNLIDLSDAAMCDIRGNQIGMVLHLPRKLHVMDIDQIMGDFQ